MWLLLPNKSPCVGNLQETAALTKKTRIKKKNRSGNNEMGSAVGNSCENEKSADCGGELVEHVVEKNFMAVICTHRLKECDIKY